MSNNHDQFRYAFNCQELVFQNVGQLTANYKVYPTLSTKKCIYRVKTLSVRMTPNVLIVLLSETLLLLISSLFVQNDHTCLGPAFLTEV